MYFSNKIYGNYFIKQHSENCYGLRLRKCADCSLKNKFIVWFIIIFQRTFVPDWRCITHWCRKLRVIKPHRYEKHKTRPVVTDVRWSVCLSVCLWQPWALQTRLNRSRCHLGVESGGPKKPCIRWQPGFRSTQKGNFSAGEFPTHSKV